MSYPFWFNKILTFFKGFSWYENLTILIFTYPLFSQKNQVILFGLWIMGSIYYSSKNRTFRKLNFKKIKILFSLSIIYLVYLVEFILSRFNNVISSYLETGALLLVFPVFIILNFESINKKLIDAIFSVYVISISILNLIILAEIIDTGLFDLLKKDSFYQPVFRDIYAAKSGVHLPYLGLMFQFSGLVIIYQLYTKYKERSKIMIILLLLNFLLLNISSFLFSARMALGASFITLIFLLFKTERSKKQRLIYIFSGFLIAVLLSSMPPVKRRIMEVFETKMEMPGKKDVGKHYQVNIRYAIYMCSYNVLKDNWLIGVGVKNIQDGLQNCYKSIEYVGWDDFNSRKYNTHNQYFHFFMAYGIFGLGVILYFLFNGWKKGGIIYQTFIILIALSFLTENILNRQAGIVFFVLFNTVFYLRRNIGGGQIDREIYTNNRESIMK